MKNKKHPPQRDNAEEVEPNENENPALDGILTFDICYGDIDYDGDGEPDSILF